MRNAIFFQYAFMIAVSFICGVVASRFISIELSQTIMEIIDIRVLDFNTNMKSAVVPVAISFIVVLLFSTHPYLYFAGLLCIAFKAVFFGFSSVFMMEQGNSVLQYISWWFPFQLVYIILLICLYKICRVRLKREKIRAKRLLPIICILFICTIYLEYIVISYVLK